jgi:hypothetical protein
MREHDSLPFNIYLVSSSSLTRWFNFRLEGRFFSREFIVGVEVVPGEVKEVH